MQEFVARQPIFNTKLHIEAYELLFRAGTDNHSMDIDPIKATSSVVNNGLFLVGLDKLTSGKPMFINFSEELLTSDVITFLPRDKTVIEVLETVNPTAKVLEACKKLKEQGYVIALDDFVYHKQLEPFIELADIIKVDFLISPASYCQAMPKKFSKSGIRFLAEKVESYEQFKKAVTWGYTLFQGYFFCKPDVVTTADIAGNQLVYFQLLQELNNPHIEVSRLEQIIQKDVALAYKLLKYLNSAAVGLKGKIESIKQAITLLGNDNLAKFVSIVLLQGHGKSKPNELANTAMVRGRFSELLAQQTGLEQLAADAFLVGLFSLLDALLDRSMQEVLAELSLKDSVQQTLERKNTPLVTVLETVIAYERADWEKVEEWSCKLEIDTALLKTLYLEAVAWAWEVQNQLKVPVGAR